MRQIDDTDQRVVELVRNFADHAAHGRKFLHLHDALMIGAQPVELVFHLDLAAIDRTEQVKHREEQQAAADDSNQPQQHHAAPQGIGQPLGGAIDRQHGLDFPPDVILDCDRHIELDQRGTRQQIFRMRNALGRIENTAGNSRPDAGAMRLGLWQEFTDQILRIGPDNDIIGVIELETHHARDFFQRRKALIEVRLRSSVRVVNKVFDPQVFMRKSDDRLFDYLRLALDQRILEKL